MVPTIGKIVLYTLSSQDAAAINRRRADAKEKLPWHHAIRSGAQIHVGNDVRAGDVFPLIITRVWGDGEAASFNGQLLLDGNDLFWLTSISFCSRCKPLPDEPKQVESVRHIGKFQMLKSFTEDSPNLVRSILATVVVISKSMLDHETVEYIGLCDDFDPIAEGAEPPLYKAGSIQEGVFCWHRLDNGERPTSRKPHQFTRD